MNMAEPFLKSKDNKIDATAMSIQFRQEDDKDGSGKSFPGMSFKGMSQHKKKKSKSRSSLPSIYEDSYHPDIDLDEGGTSLLESALREEYEERNGVGTWSDSKTRFLCVFLLVKDALHSRKTKFSTSFSSLKWYKVIHSSWYRTLLGIVSLVQMSLSFFEAPARYQQDNSTGYIQIPTNKINNHITNETSTRSLKTQRGIVLTLDFICIAVFATDIWITLKAVGRRNFRRSRWFPWNVVFLFAMFCDLMYAIIFALANQTQPSFQRSFHVTRMFRPFFLIFNRRNLGDIFLSILKVIPSLGFIMGMLLLFLILFSGFGFLLLSPIMGFHLKNGTDYRKFLNHSLINQSWVPWDGVSCSTYSAGFDCNDYFFSPPAAMYELWLLSMKSNWPNVMLPYIDERPVSSSFFVAFILLGNLFIVNLILATSFKSYKDSCRKRHLRRRAYSTASIKLAYDVIKDGNEKKCLAIDWQRLVTTMKPSMPNHVGRLIFDTLDENGEGAISLHEFRIACRLLNINVLQIPYEDDIPEIDNVNVKTANEQGVTNEHVHRHKRIETLSTMTPMDAADVVEKSWFGIGKFRSRKYIYPLMFILDGVVDIICLVSVYSVFMLSREGSNHDTTPTSFSGVLSYIIVFFFSLEMSLKVWFYGWKRYWSRDWMNKLDVFIIIVTIVSMFFVSFVNADDHHASNSTDHPRLLTHGHSLKGHSDQPLPFQVQIVLSLRFIRFLRLIRLTKRFRIIFITVTELIPMVSRVLLVLLLILYFFSVLGNILFGPHLRRGNFEVEQSSYGILNYWSLNFDTVINGILTLFTFILQPKYGVIVEGCMAAYNSYAPVIYFVAFYVIGVLISMNVLVAFIVESYTSLHDQVVYRCHGFGFDVKKKSHGIVNRRSTPLFISSLFNLISNHFLSVASVPLGSLGRPSSGSFDSMFVGREDEDSWYRWSLEKWTIFLRNLYESDHLSRFNYEKMGKIGRVLSKMQKKLDSETFPAITQKQALWFDWPSDWSLFNKNSRGMKKLEHNNAISISNFTPRSDSPPPPNAKVASSSFSSSSASRNSMPIPLQIKRQKQDQLQYVVTKPTMSYWDKYEMVQYLEKERAKALAQADMSVDQQIKDLHRRIKELEKLKKRREQ